MESLLTRISLFVERLFKAVFANLPPITLARPAISSFSPAGGWPGTIVTVTGHRFSNERDGNLVMVGGSRALVISASATKLVVLVGERTVTGSIEVTTSDGVGRSLANFQVLPIPDVRDTSLGGPPVFFHGPQPGTPQLGVPDQPVLVIFTYPTDQNPGTPAQRVALLNTEIPRFEQARRFWQEASYGTTSWKFTYTTWLPLPANRDYYMWQADDARFARFRLLEETKRDAVFTGVVWATHRDNAMAMVNVSNPASPIALSYTGANVGGTGIRITGERAFVTAGAMGLYVFDLVNSPPTFVKRVPAIGWHCDLDLAGNRLAIAALGAGLLLYDVTITALPTLRGTHFFGGNLATSVRIVGTRAYVGVDNFVRVIDIANMAAPVEIAHIDVLALVLDLSLDGTLLAVATDGKGVSLLDVSVTPPVIRSTIMAVPRVHGVCLNGGRLYTAGGDAGLAIYDVGNPAGPVARGRLAMVPAAYNVAVSGGFAYVSLGRRRLAVVNVIDPNNPQTTGTTLLGGNTMGNVDPDLATLRTNIDVALKNQDLTQRHGALWVDALNAAEAGGFDLDGFKGIVVVVNGPFLRGASGPSGQYQHEDTGQTFKLNDTKGGYYVATNATWGRVAHETGHWLGMQDIYQEAQGDGTFIVGTAGPWCLSGDCDFGTLFSARQMHDTMHFYSTKPGVENVKQRDWSPTAPAMNETFDIVAHDTNQNTDPSRTHVVKLVVASGLIYYVEVRQRPNGRIFDQVLPATIDPTVLGAVVVTRATEGTSFSNTFERPIMLMGELTVGQQVVDAVRGLTIRVDSIVQNRPLVYRVRITWNQPLVGDPNGKFDMTMTPWNTDTWDTVDIWVDSQKNNSGATRRYEINDGDDTHPVRNGDRPWVRHPNTIFARIRNTGPQAVNDVFVSFYGTSPPGIGDNGGWALLGTRQIATLPGRDPAIPGSGEMLVEYDWTPDKDSHTCLKVAIFPQAGEIEPANNGAQENVFTFDSAGSSSHDPVRIDAAIRSPFTVWKRVDAVVRGLPAGWHAVVDHSWVWTSPKGERAVTAVVWTDLNAPYSFDPTAPTRHIQKRALARIEGWTDHDHRYVPIGGILADVKATRKVSINWEVMQHGDRLIGRGCLSPSFPGVPITVEITSRKGERILGYLMTDASGCFDLINLSDLKLRPGEYAVQVFVVAGTDAAETETEPRVIEIR